MTGTDYWIRQQISLAQWRDFHKEAERERQLEMALNGQAHFTWVSQVRNRFGRMLLSLASWLLRDNPQPGPRAERLLRLESRPGR